MKRGNANYPKSYIHQLLYLYLFLLLLRHQFLNFPFIFGFLFKCIFKITIQWGVLLVLFASIFLDINIVLLRIHVFNFDFNLMFDWTKYFFNIFLLLLTQFFRDFLDMPDFLNHRLLLLYLIIIFNLIDSNKFIMAWVNILINISI